MAGCDKIFFMGSPVFPKIARRAAPKAAPYSPSEGQAIEMFKEVAMVSNQYRDRLPPPIANSCSGQGQPFSAPPGSHITQMLPLPLLPESVLLRC